MQKLRNAVPNRIGIGYFREFPSAASKLEILVRSLAQLSARSG